MKITPKFQFASGSFDTENTKMICVASKKHNTVELCIKSDGDKGWNIPIAEIKLYSGNLLKAAELVFEDAALLCQEIANRWNSGSDKDVYDRDHITHALAYGHKGAKNGLSHSEVLESYKKDILKDSKRMEDQDLCSHCKQDRVVLVEGIAPYNVGHLQCPSCDSTFNIEPPTKSK